MRNGFSLLTTSQAAGLLEVHESSVKRWTNDGALRLTKTKGGHRRISLAHLIEFARAERPDAALLLISPYEAELTRAALAARERNDFGPLADLILILCDRASPSYLIKAMRYLESACGVPVSRSLDLGMAEALRRIGAEWAEGRRTVAQEHRFTQKVMDALHGLRHPEPDLVPASAPLAVVGVAESCYHEIGAMCVRLALEAAGWQVCYLGSDVPFDEFAGIQAELRARLVAVSFVAPMGNADAMRCLNALEGRYRGDKPYYVALGGGGLAPENLALGRRPFLEAKVWKSTESLQTWAKARVPARAPGRPRPDPG